MARRLTARWMGILALALLVVVPFLSGCGGAKEEQGGGSYYNGTMKGKGAPGGGGATKTQPGGTGAGGP